MRFETVKMNDYPTSHHHEYYEKIFKDKSEIERLFNEIIDSQTHLDYVPDDVKELIEKIHQWKNNGE